MDLKDKYVIYLLKTLNRENVGKFTTSLDIKIGIIVR